MSDESSDENVRGTNTKSTKKRKKSGRLTDTAKTLRNSTLETGPDCNCKRYECFKNISEHERSVLINQFNSIGREEGYNAQNSYLCGLISLHPVKQRRPRLNENEARLNESSYTYKVRVVRDGNAMEVPVCFKGFQSIFGIKAFRLHSIKTSMRKTGLAPIDGRGKHSNRPHTLDVNLREAVMSFFGSLKGRKAHYSLNDSDKVYLPEETNLKSLLGVFLNQNPGMEISYESFRKIFECNFNIGFGYPRSDTCCWCDEHKAKIVAVEKKDIPPEDKEKELNTLHKQRELHLKKADWFYKLKRKAKQLSRKDKTVQAIAIDFGRNLPTPNITTSEVYFKRQLTFYIFNVHMLSSGRSVMYTYDQTVAKKGSDDVASMLFHFFNNFLEETVKTLYIFADSCGGQNKNHTIIQFLHYIASNLNLFETIVITYPVRGHSFMETDKNMALIPKCARAETPDAWRTVIANCRVNPSPFDVVSCDQAMFKKWGEFLASKSYKQKFCFAVRPLKQLRMVNTKTRTIEHRDTYNGAYYTASALMTEPEKRRLAKARTRKHLPPLKELSEPEDSYHAPIPLPKEKYADLKSLVRFCEDEGTTEYYTMLLTLQDTAQPVPEGVVEDHDECDYF